MGVPQGLPQDQFYAPHLWLVPAAQAVAAGVRHHRPAGTDSDDWMMIGGLISVIFFYPNGPNMSQLQAKFDPPVNSPVLSPGAPGPPWPTQPSTSARPSLARRPQRRSDHRLGDDHGRDRAGLCQSILRMKST